MSRKLLANTLVMALLLGGCQKTAPTGAASPGTNSTAAGTATSASAAAIELQVSGKNLSFEPVSAWLDPRGDTRSGSITLGNYDFTVTKRNTHSLPDVTEGQVRAIVGLASPQGADFNKPVPPGEYTAEALKFTDVVSYQDGKQNRYNFKNPKGKVIVTEVTDTDLAGSVDLTDDNGAVLKGGFRAKIATESTADAGAEPAGKLPFDFPAAALAAKAGETVLTPSPTSVYDMIKTGNKRVADFRPHKLLKPGPETSSIDDNGKPIEIPNALVVTLSPHAKAMKGDLVLAYPKYGSMERAIVTDAGNAAEPTVHFFKKVFEKTTAEGQEFTGKLEKGTFKVLEEGVVLGAMVLHPKGDDKGLGQVINVSGDRVLVSTFGGDLEVYSKTEVTAFPLKPKLKPGDKVQAPFAGGVDDATVVRVDETVGRVLVKWDGGSKREALFSYGEVMPANS